MSMDPGFQTPSDGHRAGYEFSAQENDTIRRLAGTMKFVAIFQLLAGIINLAAGVLNLIRNNPSNAFGHLGQGVFYVVLSLVLMGAASRFRAVVDTQGHDVPHLMSALEQLRRFFNAYRILIILMLLLMAVLIPVYLLTRPTETVQPTSSHATTPGVEVPAAPVVPSATPAPSTAPAP